MNINFPLRICVDARPLLHKGGISRYVYEMIQSLSREEGIELILIVHKKITCPSLKNVTLVLDTAFSFLPGTLWFFLRGPILAKRYQCHILWGTQHILPFPKRGIRYIVTWHDVVWRVLPSSMRFTNRYLNHLLAHHTIHVAHHIVCVSQTTEQTLTSFYPKSQGKTTVILEGKSLQDQSSTPCAYHFPFLFTLGSIEPRKNILALLKAFEYLVSFPSFEEYRLIIAGPKGWKNHHIFRFLKNSPIKERVIFTGFLSDEEIIAYMKASKAFIFPSLYEGFGLPLLEAEGKCPTIANDIPVFRELERFFSSLYFVDFSLPSQEVAFRLSEILLSNPHILTFRETPLTWQLAAKKFHSLCREII